MSQNARADEEQATLRRARILGMSYIDTSGPSNKQIFHDVLQLPDLYKYRIIPLEVEKSNILFGVTTTTSQQTMNDIMAHFTDQKVGFALISDNGFKDYMRLYDPPKEVKYEDINLASQGSGNLINEVSASLEQVRADDVLAYLVKQAYVLKASDIHLENRKADVRVRFRVDGVLHSIANLSRENSSS